MDLPGVNSPGTEGATLVGRDLENARKRMEELCRNYKEKLHVILFKRPLDGFYVLAFPPEYLDNGLVTPKLRWWCANNECDLCAVYQTEHRRVVSLTWFRYKE